MGFSVEKYLWILLFVKMPCQKDSGRKKRKTAKGGLMSGDKIKEIIKEIEKKYGVSFSDYREERRGGKIVFVHYTIIFKVDE